MAKPSKRGGPVTRFRVRYRRARVTVEAIKPVICAACRAWGRVECHHYRYAYSTKMVRANPQLAMDNSIFLCYQDHKIADMYRALAENQDRAHKVNEALILQILKDRRVAHAKKKTA